MTYTIEKAAEKCGLTPHTLRYYDKEGLLPFVERSDSGVRRFKESDFSWLEMINCLKETGMPIKMIRQFIEWAIVGDETIDERLEFLLEHRRAAQQKMDELQKHMDHLNDKIWYYQTAAEAGTTAIHDERQSQHSA